MVSYAHRIIATDKDLKKINPAVAAAAREAMLQKAIDHCTEAHKSKLVAHIVDTKCKITRDSGNAAFCTCTRFHHGPDGFQWPSWPSADLLPVRTRQSDRYGTSAVCKPHQHHS